MSGFPFNDSVVPPPWNNKPAYPYCPETANAPDNWAKQRGSPSYVRLRAGCSARVYGVFLSEYIPPGGPITPINPIVQYEARLNWWISSSEMPIVPYRVAEYRTKNESGLTICLECDSAKAPLGEDTVIQPWLISRAHSIDWHPQYQCGEIEKTSLWVVRLNFLQGEFRVWIVAGTSLNEVRQQRFLTSYLYPGAVFDSKNGC
jgi:hypothetical protein